MELDLPVKQLHQGLASVRGPHNTAECLIADLRQPLRRRHVSASFQLILGFFPKTSLERIINVLIFKWSAQASIFIKLDPIKYWNKEIKGFRLFFFLLILWAIQYIVLIYSFEHLSAFLKTDRGKEFLQKYIFHFKKMHWWSPYWIALNQWLKQHKIYDPSLFKKTQGLQVESIVNCYLYNISDTVLYLLTLILYHTFFFSFYLHNVHKRFISFAGNRFSHSFPSDRY